MTSLETFQERNNNGYYAPCEIKFGWFFYTGTDTNHPCLNYLKETLKKEEARLQTEYERDLCDAHKVPYESKYIQETLKLLWSARWMTDPAEDFAELVRLYKIAREELYCGPAQENNG